MLILLVSAALVAVTALAVSARFAEGSVAQWLVGAYVIAFAEIVVVSLLLSIGSHYTRWAVVGVLAVIFGISALVLRNVERPPFRATIRSIAPAFRDPTVITLAIVVLGVVGYSLALGLFRPPNDGDALGYHLPRAAFWHQDHAIGYIPGARDARLITFAPNSEIAMAFTMVTSGSGRYAPLVQLVAALAAAIAVAGLARRLGAALRDAVLVGLFFVTLPVVAMQMSTALNDVIAASFVPCAAFFIVRRSAMNSALAALAAGLGVGTKLTDLIALPILALIAIVAHGRRAVRVLAIGSAGILIGAYWYLYDAARGRGITGGISGEHAGSGIAAVVSRVLRLLLETVELPGAIRLERLWFVVAALVLAGIAIARHRMRDAGIAAAFTLAPLALVPLQHLAVHAVDKIYYELGRADVGYLDPNRSPTKASPIFSWFGPAATLLLILACVLIVRGIRRGTVPRFALVVALAPILWLILLGIAVPYWEWNGRYSIGGWAIGCASWALPLRIRPVAWATAALAVVSVALAFVHQHDRASGLRLLADDHEPSVWSEPSWHIQATDHPYYARLLQFVATRIPNDARIAIQPYVWPGSTFFEWPVLPYPYFGRDLTRTVHFAESPAEAKRLGAQWAVLYGDYNKCIAGWTREFGYARWAVLRVAPGHACA